MKKKLWRRSKTKEKPLRRSIYIRNKNIKFKIMIALFIVIALIITIISGKKYNKVDLSDFSPKFLLTQSYEIAKEEDAIVKDDKNNIIPGVEFDVFCLAENEEGEDAKRIRGTCNKIGEQSNLYIRVAVQEEGVIKDGIITINSDNFYYNTSIIKDSEVANNYISPNTKEIVLNNITNGTDKLLMGSVRSGNYSSVYQKIAAIGNDINKYSMENSINFSGIYVGNDGEERKFSKTVPIMVDWYGEIDCSLTPQSQTKSIENFNDLKTEEGVCLEFTINSAETLNELLISESYISGTVPELNGYRATSVEILGKNVEYTYNNLTGAFSAKRDAELDENGIIISNAYTDSNANARTVIRNNKFDFKVMYPLKAFEEMDENILSFDLVIPVEAVNIGYNNPNSSYGFENPIRSEVAKGIIVTYWNMDHDVDLKKPSAGINVGKYYGSPYGRYMISKEKPMNIYNGKSLEEKDDTYIVKWNAYTGTEGKTNGITMREPEGTSDNFRNSSGEDISMEEFTTNIAISFTGATDTLGRDGWIEIYNAENDNLIEKFTYRNWNSYTQDNPYYYENSVKHIKVKTSKPNQGCKFSIINKKELDVKAITDKFTQKEFENLLEIQSHLESRLEPFTDETGITYWSALSVTTSALYNSQTSIASFSTSIENNILSTQITAEHEKIIITTNDYGYNEQKWKNGIFLIKMPKNILLAEVNEITVDNSNVEIVAYDVYEENGCYFIKILTENESEEVYKITIDCNLTPDPRVSENREQMELYAINEIAYNYHYNKPDIYDVNGNLNTDELINYQSLSITFNPGSALNTTQTASNYNEENSITVAPRIAVIDKSQKTATVSVSAINYYDSNLQEIKILGVIPFKGNDYVLSGTDLGSTFTTHMNSKGIIPLTESVKDKVTIYYSTEENPTNIIDDVDNKWTLFEKVTDWNSIKTYMIVIDNSFNFAQGTSIEFQYEISLPEDTKYNDIAYSEHALYYALSTDKGLLRTSTGCARLGFMIAKQYCLEIEKYQEDTNKLLSGVTFSLTENGEDTSTIRTTNKNGVIIIPKLFAEKEYILKEQKVSNDYALNTEEIRFYTYVEKDDSGKENLYVVYVNEDGSYSKLSDKYFFLKNATIKDSEGYGIKFEIENQVKAKLEIKKTDNKTGESLKNIKYTLTGKGKNDDILITDENGQIYVSGLFLNEEYILKEVEANGYYLEKDVKFKIINNNGNFELVFLEGSFIPENNIIKQDEIPTIRFNINNEKIPTYGLQLTKYAKNEKILDENGVEKDKTLQNVQYKIYGEGFSEQGKTYTTDENGILRIDGLYEFVDGKYITGEYRLKEIYAPTGYAVNSLELKFKLERDIEGNARLKILEGGDVIRNVLETEENTGEENVREDITIQNPNTSYPTVNMGVEDGAIFSLFKYRKDPETREKIAIPGVKFMITDLEGNYVKGTDGKLIGEYVDTTPEILTPPDIELNSVGERKWYQKEDGTWETEPLENNDPPEIIFSSNSSYKWTQNSEGIWKSGNNGQKNTESVLVSNNFKLNQEATLTFDWTVSSDKYNGFLGLGAREDYAYYIITNVDTGEIIHNSGEASTKISGTDHGTNENNLTYISKSFDLSVGTYKIEFVYKKDQSRDGGLDAAYVKNVNLKTNVISDNSVSVLSSNEFQLLQEATLKFDWTVSSRDTLLNKDYAYYTITNITTGEVLENTGEDSTKICGTEYGTDYSNLQFRSESIDIPVGRYKIEFSYKRSGGKLDFSQAGLDSAFVKNVRLEAKDIEPSGYAFVETDENGLITANIGEGNYKAIEIEAPEGYDLPEKEEDRTHYFYVGEAQAAKFDWGKSIKGQGWNYINSVSSTQDDGIIAAGSFSKYSDTIISNATDGIDINNDGIVDKISEGNNDGIIISYDTSGNANWFKSIGGLEDDAFNKAIQTSDGGYAIVGYSSSKNIKFDGVEIPELSKTENFAGKDAILLKVDSTGNYEWGVRIGGKADDEIKSVIETSDKRLVVVGNYYSELFNFYNSRNLNSVASITNRGNKDGFMASYSLTTGEYQWSQGIGYTSNVEVNDVIEYSNGLMIAVTAGGKVYPTNSSTQNAVDIHAGILGYSLSGSYNNTITNIVKNGTAKITGIDIEKDGNILAAITYPVTRLDACIYRITVEENTLNSEQIYRLTGGLDEYATDIKATSDGGVLFGGWYYSTDVNGAGLEGKLALDGCVVNEYKSYGYVIKLDSENNVQYSSMLQGNGYSGVTSVTESTDGRWVSGGFFNSPTLNATNYRTEIKTDEEIRLTELITNGGNFDGFVISEGAQEAIIPERQAIEVENKLKQYTITTEVKKHLEDETEVEGGKILESIPNESVYYGYGSKGEILIKPDENYIVKTIKINDKEYNQYKLNEDGSVTLDKFQNIKENKHITVEFAPKEIELNLIVNHYLWNETGTSTEKVAESEYYIGKEGEAYTTMPNTEINYDIITNLDYYGEITETEILEILKVNSFDESNYKNAQGFLEDIYIPENYSGVYDKENPTVVVNYYYKEKTYTLTVHHYIEGTSEPVPLKDPSNTEFSLDPDERYVNIIYHYGDSYETTRSTR